MSKAREFLDVDVLTAARARVRHIFDLFDTVAVAFSGGKDSLVCLELVREAAEELGRLPVRAFFEDEELIPDSVINFVDEYRRKPWLELSWLAVPMNATKVCLGKMEPMLFWDPARPWVRQPPEFAIRARAGDPPAHTQQTMNGWVCDRLGYRGKVAIVMGIRATESLTRFRSVVNKLSDNYICAFTDTKRAMSAKPIYDWTDTDVFAFLHQQGVPWAPTYDARFLVGTDLRVATPIHSEAVRRFHLIRLHDPDFYARLIAVFPEMRAHERLHLEVDRRADVEGYSDGFEGCRRFIQERITDPKLRALARKRLEEFLTGAAAKPDFYLPATLLRHLAKGTIQRVILPQGRK